MIVRAATFSAVFRELKSELSHIRQRPDFGDLAVFDAVHREVRNLDGAARRRDAGELARCACLRAGREPRADCLAASTSSTLT